MTLFPLVSNDSPETGKCEKDMLPEMACEFTSSCDLIFGLLNCNLLQDIIDVDLKICTLWGIYTYKKDRSSQVGKYSPLGNQGYTFPSLQKEMMEFLRQR